MCSQNSLEIGPESRYKFRQICAKIKCLAKVVEAILKQGKVGFDSGDPSILGIPSAHSDLGLDFKR